MAPLRLQRETSAPEVNGGGDGGGGVLANLAPRWFVWSSGMCGRFLVWKEGEKHEALVLDFWTFLLWPKESTKTQHLEKRKTLPTRDVLCFRKTTNAWDHHSFLLRSSNKCMGQVRRSIYSNTVTQASNRAQQVIGLSPWSVTHVHCTIVSAGKRVVSIPPT